MPLSLVLLASCGINEEVDTATPDKDIEEVEESEIIMTERIFQVNEDGLATPINIFAEWGDLPSTDKASLVEASLAYQVALGEMEGTPVQVKGSTEAFVKAMDIYYLEIEQRTDDLEKYDLMNSLIAEQVGAVGHTNHLIEWK